MAKGFSRRTFLGSVLAGLAGSASAGAPPVSLRPRLRPGGLSGRTAPEVAGLIARARLGAQVSFAVAEVSSGLMLETHAARVGMPPASVAKVVTSLYALDALGPGFRFQTRLIALGSVRDGVLRGDLVLAGGGDPTLDTDGLAEMAAGLKATGLREVRGRLRVWGGALPFERAIEPNQPGHVSYNPAVSGLNLNYNRVRFEWKRAGGKWVVSMDARSSKYRPEVRVARISVARREMPVYTYSDQGDHEQWTVASAALGKGGARWLPVRKPEAYAAEVFATFARSHGIRLRTGEPLRAEPEGEVLLRHESPPLSEILRGMIRYSNNLTAELVGMTATARRLGRALDLRESAAEMTRWARLQLGMEGAFLIDHSGLGEASRLTAAALVKALLRAHGDGLLKPILKDIPPRKENGAIDHDSVVRISAKTGTLYFVSSLAGYVTAPDGTELAFAIFGANSDLRSRYDRASEARPPGARGWNRRAKRLQQSLIRRWVQLYAS